MTTTITLKQQIEKRVKEHCSALMGLDFNEELTSVLADKNIIAGYHNAEVSFYNKLKESGKILDFTVDSSRNIIITKE